MKTDLNEYIVYTANTKQGAQKPTPPYINCELVLNSATPSSLMDAIIHQGNHKECLDFMKKYCTNSKE